MTNISRTVLSFGLMVALWGWLFQSVLFAFCFLVVIFIHEMGHYVVAKRLGIDVSEPIFTPLGALINLRQMPRNAYDEALMAYGGPFIGTIGALAAVAFGVWFQVPELLLAGRVGLWLNLFNLIPLSPLDGGRITMAIDRRLWILGAALLAGYIAISGLSLITIIFVALIAHWAINDIKGRAAQAVQDPGYFQIAAGKRFGVLAAYLGLGAFLVYALTHFSWLVSLF